MPGMVALRVAGANERVVILLSLLLAPPRVAAQNAVDMFDRTAERSCQVSPT